MNNHLSNNLDRAGNALIEVSQLYFTPKLFLQKANRHLWNCRLSLQMEAWQQLYFRCRS